MYLAAWLRLPDPHLVAGSCRGKPSHERRTPPTRRRQAQPRSQAAIESCAKLREMIPENPGQLGWVSTSSQGALRRCDGLIWPQLERQVVNAVMRIETSNLGSSTPSLAT